MTHDNKGCAKPMVDHRQNMNDPAMNYSLQNGLLNRSYQTTTSWLVRGTLLITLALLFILPLYDLFTGTISHKIWMLLVVSMSLLLYVYVIVYMVGKWNEDRHRMKVPKVFKIMLSILIVAFLVALYRDFYLSGFGIRPYIITMALAVVILFVAAIRLLIRRHKYIKNRKH